MNVLGLLAVMALAAVVFSLPLLWRRDSAGERRRRAARLELEAERARALARLQLKGRRFR